MITGRLISKDNWRTLIKIEKNLERKVSENLKEVAEAIASDAKSATSKKNYKVTGASKRGEAPAYRSRALTDGIRANESGRERYTGRFASPKNAVSWYVQVDTGTNENGNKQYAQALEDPNYLKRPFLAPAIDKRGIKHMVWAFKYKGVT